MVAGTSARTAVSPMRGGTLPNRMTGPRDAGEMLSLRLAEAVIRASIAHLRRHKEQSSSVVESWHHSLAAVEAARSFCMGTHSGRRPMTFALKGGKHPGIYRTYAQVQAAAEKGGGEMAMFEDEAQARRFLRNEEQSEATRPADGAPLLYAVRGGQHPGVYHTLEEVESALRTGGEADVFGTLPEAVQFCLQRDTTTATTPVNHGGGEQNRGPAEKGLPPGCERPRSTSDHAHRPVPVYAVKGGQCPGVYHSWEAVAAALRTGGKADMFHSLQDAIQFCLDHQRTAAAPTSRGGGSQPEKSCVPRAGDGSHVSAHSAPRNTPAGAAPEHVAQDRIGHALQPTPEEIRASYDRCKHLEIPDENLAGNPWDDDRDWGKIDYMSATPVAPSTSAAAPSGGPGGLPQAASRPNPAHPTSAQVLNSGIASAAQHGPPMPRRRASDRDITCSVTRRLLDTPEARQRQPPPFLPMGSMHEQPPLCPELRSTDRREIATWRRHLQDFEEDLAAYNTRQGCRYNPPLKQFVHRSTWA